MLLIRSEQMKVFENVASRRFQNDMVAHSKAFSPRLCEVLGDEQLRYAIDGMMERAERYGFTFKGPIRLYIEMSFLFGSGFDTDPQYPAFGRELLAEGDQMIRADRIFEAAVHYHRHVAGEKAMNVHRALRSLLVYTRMPHELSLNSYTQEILEEMHRIFPEKAAYLGDEILMALIREAEAEADRWDFASSRAKAMLAVLMFSFGHGCPNDDLYPWIRRTLRNPKIVSADARAQKLEKKAITWLEHVVAGNETGKTT